MKTQLRLDSVIPHGVGGQNAILIDILYAYLLEEYTQDKYSYIGINQIGSDLEEFVKRDVGNSIYCNIKYPTDKTFELLTEDEQNLIRLDIVHTALLRITEEDKKLSRLKIEEIKNLILSNKFTFELIYKQYPHPYHKAILAKIVVKPRMSAFEYYLVIENSEIITCKILFYTGFPVTIYSFDDLFGSGKWIGKNQFSLKGKNGEVSTTFFLQTCKVEILNRTRFEKPPFYTMMRTDISEDERQNASKNWEQSISPDLLRLFGKD